MNTYHVLLLYPPQHASYYGDTYLSDPTQANSEQAAIAQARRDCATSNEKPEGWADDFIILLVVKNGEIL